MPLIITALRVGLTWLGRLAVAAWAVETVVNLTTKQKDTITQATSQAKAAGVSDDDLTRLVAATTYDQVEQDGKEPDDFWNGLPEKEKEALKFSPQSLRETMGRTKFLGISSALFFVGALAAGGVAGLRGIPILLSTLAKLAEARKTGQTALQLLTIIEQGKIQGIAAVWIPGLIAGIASAGGWLTSGMANNLNDAFLWGRVFLGQAADDFESAKRKKDSTSQLNGSDSAAAGEPKIIIRMVEEKKPEQFIGTLFSAKLGSMESFNRHIDDEITDEADLLEDVKLNLNRWLASFPGRLGYSIVIRKNPVDEFGVQQSGMWATLTTHITRLSGPIQPIDTILLGPVKPATKLTLVKSIKTIEQQIPGILKGQTVMQIEMPNGAVDIFDTTGARVDLTKPVPTAQTPSAATPTTPATTAKTAEDILKPPSAPATQPAAAAPAAPALSVSQPSPIFQPAPQITQTTTPQTTFQAPPAPPAPAPAPIFQPQAPAPDQNLMPILRNLGQLPFTATVNTPGDVLNLRQQPNTNATVLAKLQDNSKVTVTSIQPQADGYHWVGVNVNGKQGFVAQEFLKQ